MFIVRLPDILRCVVYVYSASTRYLTMCRLCLWCLYQISYDVSSMFIVPLPDILQCVVYAYSASTSYRTMYYFEKHIIVATIDTIST